MRIRSRRNACLAGIILAGAGCAEDPGTEPRGGVCIDYAEYLHEEHRVEGFMLQGVALDGSHAYLADRDNGLVVLDVSGTEAPSVVGTLNPGSDEYHGIAVGGGRAILLGSATAFVIDVRNPAAPALLGHVDAGGGDVALSGNVACVAGAEGLSVLDLSNPAAPFVAGRSVAGGYRRVAMAGSLAYAVGWEGDLPVLDVIDVTHPEAPRWVGRLDGWDAQLHAVAVQGSRVFVGVMRSGSASSGFLYVIDGADPAHPRILGSTAIPVEPFDIAVQGAFVYVAANGVAVVRVSAPGSPVTVGWVEGNQSYGVAVSGSRAFAAGFGLQVMDITGSESAPVLGYLEEDEWVYGAAFTSSHAFVARGAAGMDVLDLETPGAPVVVGTLEVPGEIARIAVSGSHAYAAGRGDVHVIDISNPSTPALVGSVTAWEYNLDLCVGGSLVFVVGHSGMGGLKVIDASDPSAPRVVATLDTLIPMGCAMAGSNLILVAGGLHVVDVSQPDNPRIVGTACPGEAGRVTVDGPYAYLFGYQGLQIVDVSNASSPHVVGGVHQGGWGVAVPVIRGSHVYLGGTDLFVVDVSDPASPFVCGGASTQSIVAVGVNRPYVYAFSEDGLYVLPDQCDGSE